MGSGSSKESASTRPSGEKPLTVANVNNNTTEKVRPVESKTIARNDSETTNNSPSKSPVKESNWRNSKSEQSPVKSAKNNERKSTGKNEWDDSDVEDDDWDDILGKTSTRNVSKVPPNQHERDLNSYNQRESEEHYPETYAQRHTRQQYTFGQDRLLREKTIYRNPEEWKTEDDEEEEEKKKSRRDPDCCRQTLDVSVSKGFDASRFRAANQGQSARDKEIFTPRQDDIEMPKYTQYNEPTETKHHHASRKLSSRQVPTYTKEEEDLMEELMAGGDLSDLVVSHQAVDSARVMDHPDYFIAHQAADSARVMKF